MLSPERGITAQAIHHEMPELVQHDRRIVFIGVAGRPGAWITPHELDAVSSRTSGTLATVVAPLASDTPVPVRIERGQDVPGPCSHTKHALPQRIEHVERTCQCPIVVAQRDDEWPRSKDRKTFVMNSRSRFVTKHREIQVGATRRHRDECSARVARNREGPFDVTGPLRDDATMGIEHFESHEPCSARVTVRRGSMGGRRARFIQHLPVEHDRDRARFFES